MSSAIHPVTIGNKGLGDGQPSFIVAGIGINHNGDLELAKRLISAAAAAGCDAVTFQKRTIEFVYSREELAQPNESPFGNTSGDLERGLEFGPQDFEEIDACCRAVSIRWFASCWDETSVDLIGRFDVPCFQIPSASLTNDNLLKHTRAIRKPILLSTGMSTIEEIDHAVEVLGRRDLVLLHSANSFPAVNPELNLRAISTLRERYCVPVGYSGNETNIPPSVAAVVLGACCVARHITLDPTMWGSHQAASLEPDAFRSLVCDIRLIEDCMGDGVQRFVKAAAVAPC